jgi:hypothetical protein
VSPLSERADDLDMSFEPRCPQCLFVSRELGQPTPCLLHVSLGVYEPTAELPTETSLSQGYDEPYTFGQRRPTVDRPGPFSLREYVKLQLLRTRLQANPSPLDQPTRTQARSLSRR